ncbi:unnamed protein product [Linum tenue]|uniref:Uncharacterized protein n=1 Tax=Linum tenue TaxID=586396 RepID=A0AAV0MDT2_9ROSI|nr:unnamed protein product [Linum tenue]
MDASPKRGGGASSKSKSSAARGKPGRKPKEVNQTDAEDPKSSMKTEDDSGTKNKEPTLEEWSSSAKLSKANINQKTAGGRSSSSAKGKGIKGGAKSKANGTGKPKTGSTKAKDTEVEDSTDDESGKRRRLSRKIRHQRGKPVKQRAARSGRGRPKLE